MHLNNMGGTSQVALYEVALSETVVNYLAFEHCADSFEKVIFVFVTVYVCWEGRREEGGRREGWEGRREDQQRGEGNGKGGGERGGGGEGDEGGLRKKESKLTVIGLVTKGPNFPDDYSKRPHIRG